MRQEHKFADLFDCEKKPHFNENYDESLFDYETTEKKQSNKVKYLLDRNECRKKGKE